LATVGAENELTSRISADLHGALGDEAIIEAMSTWFSASMRIIILVSPEGGTSQDDVVHVFRADGWDEAFSRALELGRSHETDYVNVDGAAVRWRLDRVTTLDILRAEYLDGAEVFSSMSEVVGGPPFDTVFEPERHRPTQTGV
jgi:hypothetical protein